MRLNEFTNTCKRLKVILFLILISVCAYSSWTPIINHFSPKHYKAGTQNWDIVEQSNGWIYMANNYGLLEYDGSYWRLYGIENGTAVRSVALGDNGAIYVGGTDEFGMFRPNELGELVYTNLSNNIAERYSRFGEVWRLQVADGILYVQTRHYIFICTAEGEIDVLDPGAIIYESLVWEGNLYVSTSRDMYVYTGNRFHVLRDSEKLRGAVVCGLLPYKDDYLLIATDFQGLYIYDGQTISRFRTEIDEYITNNQLYAVTTNKEKLVFGTVRGGVVITDIQGRNSEYITRSDGLQNNTVLSLLFDSRNYLWVGLDNGIDIVDYASPVYFFHDENIDYGSGYCSMEYNGKLYLGTNQGLYVLEDNKLSLIKGSQGQVWNICKIGSTLFCCHNRGLFIVENHSLLPLDCSDGVWSVFPIDDDSAIVGSYIGFYYLSHEGKKWQMNYLNGFDETALYYTLDKENNIWLLSSRGVEYLEVNIDSLKVKSRVVIAKPSAQHTYSLALYNGDVYVTSDDYFGVTEKDNIVESDNFVGTNRYLHIGEDADKNRWFIYNNRVVVQPYDSESGSYGEEQIVYHSSFLIDGFCNVSYPQSGGIIVGGVDGFYYLSIPKQYKQQDNNIYIRRIVSLEDMTNTLLYGESYQNTEIKYLKIPPYDRSLRVELCGRYTMNNELLFRTRLYPMEDDFTRWTNLAYWDFITLPAGGRYRLDIEMMEANTGKIYSRSLLLELVYPWYLSLWAKVLYLLLIICTIFYICYRIYRNVQAGKRRLAELKNEEINQQQLRILQLENEKAQYDLRNKSQELSHILLSEANRKELNMEILNEIHHIVDYLSNDRVNEAKTKIQILQRRLARNAETSIDWKRFEENFDIVNNQFISRLSKKYPWMNKQERRLCIYIHIGLSSKEIAPLLNVSLRAVEVMRYRLRNKMEIDSSVSLKQYFREFQLSE